MVALNPEHEHNPKIESSHHQSPAELEIAQSETWSHYAQKVRHFGLCPFVRAQVGLLVIKCYYTRDDAHQRNRHTCA